MAGYWEFPGGKCEPGESPAAATARECREEIGLEVVVGSPAPGGRASLSPRLGPPVVL